MTFQKHVLDLRNIAISQTYATDAYFSEKLSSDASGVRIPPPEIIQNPFTPDYAHGTCILQDGEIVYFARTTNELRFLRSGVTLTPSVVNSVVHLGMCEVDDRIVMVAVKSGYTDAFILVADRNGILHERVITSELQNPSYLYSADCAAFSGLAFVSAGYNLFTFDPVTFAILNQRQSYLYLLLHPHATAVYAKGYGSTEGRFYDTDLNVSPGEPIYGIAVLREVHSRIVRGIATRPGIGGVTAYASWEFMHVVPFHGPYSTMGGFIVSFSNDNSRLLIGGTVLTDTSYEVQLHIHDITPTKRLITPVIRTVPPPDEIRLIGSRTEQIRTFWRTGDEAQQGPDIAWKPYPETQIVPMDGYQLMFLFGHTPWSQYVDDDGTRHFAPYISGSLESPVLERVELVYAMPYYPALRIRSVKL